METVSVRTHKKLQVKITTGQGHTIIADEPVADGGENAGPPPFELLLSALGACTAMTLVLYIRRKQWPVEGVEVDLDHSRVPGVKPADPNAATPVIDRIGVRVRVKGPLDEEQRQRLAYVASRCPVCRALTGSPEVVETLEVVSG